MWWTEIQQIRWNKISPSSNRLLFTVSIHSLDYIYNSPSPRSFFLENKKMHHPKVKFPQIFLFRINMLSLLVCLGRAPPLYSWQRQNVLGKVLTWHTGTVHTDERRANRSWWYSEDPTNSCATRRDAWKAAKGWIEKHLIDHLQINTTKTICYLTTSSTVESLEFTIAAWLLMTSYPILHRRLTLKKQINGLLMFTIDIFLTSKLWSKKVAFLKEEL